MVVGSESIVKLMGIPVTDVNPAMLIDKISLAIQNSQRLIVANVNVHAMNLIYEQRALFTFFTRHAGIVFCDGFGVKLGARLIGIRIHHRLTPPDWIDDLCVRCVEQSVTLYLLGAREEVAARAAERLQAQHPGLRIVGTHHGFFDKSPNHADNEHVIQQINAAQPNILLVAFGMPLQELWLMENWEQLNTTVAITVGALFNYLGGEIRRPPRWMTDNGMEWLGRLLIEPRRLWQRYIVGIPRFFWRLLRYALSIRLTHMQDSDS